jgi:hypothetical protein
MCRAVAHAAAHRLLDQFKREALPHLSSPPTKTVFLLPDHISPRIVVQQGWFSVHAYDAQTGFHRLDTLPKYRDRIERQTWRPRWRPSPQRRLRGSLLAPQRAPRWLPQRRPVPSGRCGAGGRQQPRGTPARRPEHARHRLGFQLGWIVTIARQHREFAHAGQRVDEFFTTDATLRGRDVRPPQTESVLATEQQVGAATVRIRIDQHGTAARPHRGDRKGRCERARARTAPATDDADRYPARTTTIDRVSQSRNKPRLSVRQHGDVLGTDAERTLPDIADTADPAVGEIAAHQHDIGSTSKRGPVHRDADIVTNQDQRCPGPRGPRRRRSGCHLDLDPCRRAQPKDVVEKIGIGRDELRAVAAYRDGHPLTMWGDDPHGGAPAGTCGSPTESEPLGTTEPGTRTLGVKERPPPGG